MSSKKSSKKSKKKSKQNPSQGSYALCITFGLVIGFGLGGAMDNMLLLTGLGVLVGWGAGYYFTHHHRSGPK